MKNRITTGEITIASLNLHCGVRSNGRPYDVQAAILGLDAQVIVLQETWSVDSGPDPVAAAAEQVGARSFRIDLSPPTTLASLLRIEAAAGTGSFGMAVLSTLPVVGYEVVELGQLAGDVVPRAAQILTIELPDERRLRLVATHLTHRFVSPGQLWRLIRRLNQTPVPTIIVGDLNMPRVVAGLAPGYSPTTLGRTFPAEVPMLQLDHVLTSQEVDRVQGTVLPAVGSDHLPVRVRISVRPDDADGSD